MNSSSRTVVFEVSGAIHLESSPLLIKITSLWQGKTAPDGSITSGRAAINSNTGPTDTDRDGMPDTWEDKNGLNKTDASAAMAPA